MELSRDMHASRHRITVDWSLIAITVVAASLLVATSVRTTPEPVPGQSRVAGGLHVLEKDERLISFEDFNFGAHGWSAASLPASGAGVAASAFGPFNVTTIAKSYSLPSDTAQVRVAFDLHLIDGWSGDGLTVSVNGEPVIANLSEATGGSNVVLRQDPQGDYAVWIALDDPGEIMSLELGVTPGVDAAWAIDNLSVVAAMPTS